MLLSCGEDRDDDNTQQNTISQKIVGTWTIVKKESNGTNVSASLPCTNLGNFVFGSDFKLSENHSSVVNSNCFTDSDNYTFLLMKIVRKSRLKMLKMMFWFIQFQIYQIKS
ncbi:hypothetical protein EIB75_12830 [Epilithonimonas vandammei]|uniref:Lipocalin-like domain-containing protein n=1 Tax=Epilithonimonas vandammei TaxID=2487072 RepID=A0A3G8ZHH6_9FLAO|nr:MULTISPECIES: hypothetical protein [Epilithonimonas]AZI56087.1 hypothetical protein EIB75_12830 [Epilithonimonas vandammei]